MATKGANEAVERPACRASPTGEFVQRVRAHTQTLTKGANEASLQGESNGVPGQGGQPKRCPRTRDRIRSSNGPDLQQKSERKKGGALPGDRTPRSGLNPRSGRARAARALRNSKFEIRNSKCEIRNSKLEIRNSKFGVRNRRSAVNVHSTCSEHTNVPCGVSSHGCIVFER